MIECQVSFMLQVIEEMQKRNASYINVKKEAELESANEYDKGHQSTVWGNANCGSWYVNPKGKITTLWPYDVIRFWRLTSSLDVDHLEFQ